MNSFGGHYNHIEGCGIEYETSIVWLHMLEPAICWRKLGAMDDIMCAMLKLMRPAGKLSEFHFFELGLQPFASMYVRVGLASYSANDIGLIGGLTL
jgi:hypothetical protein